MSPVRVTGRGLCQGGDHGPQRDQLAAGAGGQAPGDGQQGAEEVQCAAHDGTHGEGWRVVVISSVLIVMGW